MPLLCVVWDMIKKCWRNETDGFEMKWGIFPQWGLMQVLQDRVKITA